MKIRLTFLATLIIVITAGCTKQDNEVETAELTVNAKSAEFLKELDKRFEEEHVIVRQRYNQLNANHRAEMTLGEYHTDLMERYSTVIAQLEEGFQSFDRNSDPQLQLNQLRDSLMVSQKIPEWYQKLRANRHDDMMKILLPEN